MILSVPSLDVLRGAIHGGLLPTEAIVSACMASFDSSGALSVESNIKLLKSQKTELIARGITEVKRHFGEMESFANWLQLFPLVPISGAPALTQHTPVLFDLPDTALMSEFVTEMLRLGNDRQSFRGVAGPKGSTRVLLRVIGPPYYTLLRAIDRFADSPNDITAYVEQFPRVWVQLGFSHPLLNHVKLKDGQVLFVSAPRRWEFVADAPFQDVYEVLDFPLPHAPIAHADLGPEETISIPLRLAAGNSADIPEFWVLPESGIDSLDAFVRDADERLLRRLRFAVGTSPDGTKRIVLNVAPSKQAPPTLSFPGMVGFKPYWKLPNLFMPTGMRLHPPLRRETVRRLLADQPETVVWLSPENNGRFVPYSIPENSFRPLDEWVNYVIEQAREPIAEWIAATTFDFDSFICIESGPKPGSKGGGGKGSKATEPRNPKADVPPGKVVEKPKADSFQQLDIIPDLPVSIRTPTEWEIRRSELEAEFIGDGTGALDTPERKQLWPAMAECNAVLRDHDDAARCVLNALWNETTINDNLIQLWNRSERGDTPLSPEYFNSLMIDDPKLSEVRSLAAAILEGVNQPWFAAKIPAVQNYLTVYDSRLPVRAAWLVAVTLSKKAGSDSLGLARTRDRILTRLYEGGLNPERDLPTFLRYAGLKDSERVRVVREKAMGLYLMVRKWVQDGLQEGPAHTASDSIHTLIFLDLAFAFAFARLQDQDTSRQLFAKADKSFEASKDPNNIFRSNIVPLIIQAYRYRIDQTATGKPHVGPLPAEIHQAYRNLQAGIQAERNSRASNTVQATGNTQNTLEFSSHGWSRYLELSRVVEPSERVDPYGSWTRSTALKESLFQLQQIPKPDELIRTTRTLLTRGYANVPPTPTEQFLILHSVVPLAGRVGEAFALELLQRVPAVLGAVPSELVESAQRQGELLERSLYLAAHFDRRELMQSLIDAFVALVKTKTDEQKYALINAVGGTCLRNLKKFGQREELERMFLGLQNEVLKGVSLEQVKSRFTGKPIKLWIDCLQCLLNLSGAWLSIGNEAPAQIVLDLAEKELLHPAPTLAAIDMTKLVQTTIGALGAGRLESGLMRIEQLIANIRSSKFKHALSTAPYYSRLHLMIVEAIVFALTSEDTIGGLNGRRWRDEDEYIVRKRINEEVRGLA